MRKAKKPHSSTSLEKQREIAKIGMGVSLALTATTALFMKNPRASKLHTLSGVALVGFSLWHYSLYPKLSQRQQNKV